MHGLCMSATATAYADWVCFMIFFSIASLRARISTRSCCCCHSFDNTLCRVAFNIIATVWEPCDCFDFWSTVYLRIWWAYITSTMCNWNEVRWELTEADNGDARVLRDRANALIYIYAIHVKYIVRIWCMNTIRLFCFFSSYSLFCAFPPPPLALSLSHTAFVRIFADSVHRTLARLTRFVFFSFFHFALAQRCCMLSIYNTVNNVIVRERETRQRRRRQQRSAIQWVCCLLPTESSRCLRM